MRLAAMMGLMVEEVSERPCKPFRDLDRIGERRVGEVPGKARLVEAVDPGNDAVVLGARAAASPVKSSCRMRRVATAPRPLS